MKDSGEHFPKVPSIEISRLRLTRTLAFTPRGDLIDSTREPLAPRLSLLLNEEDGQETKSEVASALIAATPSLPANAVAVVSASDADSASQQ